MSGLGIDKKGGIVINNGMNSHTDLRRFDLPANYSRPTQAREWAEAVGHYSMTWQLVNNIFQQVADMSRSNESRVYTKDTR